MNETRAKIALTVASLLCLWGAVEAWQWENGYQSHTRDPFALRAQEDRMVAINAALPANAVVGYTSDIEAGSNADGAAFNSVRYFLAPRMLVRGTKPAYVLGLFTKPGNVTRVASANGLNVVLPFNNGVVLYQHGSAR